MTPSSIDALPPEILAEIILYSPTPRLCSQPSWTTVPWSQNWTRLRLVSHQWNSIILDTPQLWSHLTIHIDPKSLRNPTTSSVELWLRSSRSLPLNLEFSVENRDPLISQMDRHVSDVLDLLWKEVDRWRTIHFVLETRRSEMWAQANRSLLNARMLEFFGLTYVDLRPGSRDAIEATMRAIAAAPALHALQIDSFNWSVLGAIRRELELKRLTRLDLFICVDDLSNVYTLLQECPSLLSVYLRIWCQVQEEYLYSVPRIHLPNLRVFFAECDLPMHLENLLSPLLAPKLELLSFHFPPPPDSWGSPLLSVSTFPTSLCVLSLSELNEDQIISLFSDSRLAHIPVVEVGVGSVKEDELEEVRDLVENWVDFKGNLEIEDLGRLWVVGWKDPAVFVQFNEYFAHPWTELA
ncbi:hypothetical protein D9756_011365 [Leucocoprinus leucothites]|uniref:F-box domain-containing protein n=1 Tax=Leucocoprinus leucothites TaxID=201217 RepID=A0A8H5CNI9_9AGAR|nr:hypothetical protein D9756_011365 [Leucoagaricus leucothites]